MPDIIYVFMLLILIFQAAEKQCDEATKDSGPVSGTKAEDGAKETKETAEDKDQDSS